MNLLSAQQIREWDSYTIKHEPVASVDLMERAAIVCVNWMKEHLRCNQFYIFCGTGNNGGDGLAMARLLYNDHNRVKVFILNNGGQYAKDFTSNFERLKALPDIEVLQITTKADFPDVPKKALVVDALFGTGLNRPLEGSAMQLVSYLNQAGNAIISIDIPSGLLCDQSSKGYTAIRAAHTLTFQRLKKAFLVAENEMNIGCPHVLDIGLDPDFPCSVNSNLQLTDSRSILSIYKLRQLFSHKGNFGHALLFAGSYGKMGAAVLGTKACLRSGAGLVTAHIPQNGVDIIQVSAPEAMCRIDAHKERITSLNYDLTIYNSIGIGPGIGMEADTAQLLYTLITAYNKPMVIDADALNILSQHKEWLKQVPAGSVLTPHPKEFARLFGDSANDFEKINLAMQKAEELNLVIVLKGHHTFIATPDAKGYFNTTGNAGMATGGSGDVLTGILTGLLAQGYQPAQAAILGVYLHGLAGDKAAEKYGMDALIAGDLVEEMKYPNLSASA